MLWKLYFLLCYKWHSSSSEMFITRHPLWDGSASPSALEGQRCATHINHKLFHVAEQLCRRRGGVSTEDLQLEATVAFLWAIQHLFMRQVNLLIKVKINKTSAPSGSLDKCMLLNMLAEVRWEKKVNLLMDIFSDKIKTGLMFQYVI